jgi:hypothetical protein
MSGIKRPFHNDRCRGCGKTLTTRKTINRAYCKQCWQAKELGGDGDGSAF